MAAPARRAGGTSSEDALEEIVRRKPVRENAMSSITKLLIQGELATSLGWLGWYSLPLYPGIRGFGVSDGEKAVIEFGKPLTLITGQNGAGKTVSLQDLSQLAEAVVLKARTFTP
jgi:AAA15 family ATPase/GTPase